MVGFPAQRGGVSVSPELLTALLQEASVNPDHGTILLNLITAVGQAVANMHKVENLSHYSFWQAVDGLEALLTQTEVTHLLLKR